MNLYRNKEDGKLYWAENVIKEWHYTDFNAHAGVYVYPYKWEGKAIIYYYNDYNGQEKALMAFYQDFEVVAELFYL